VILPPTSSHPLERKETFTKLEKARQALEIITMSLIQRFDNFLNRIICSFWDVTIGNNLRSLQNRSRVAKEDEHRVSIILKIYLIILVNVYSKEKNNAK
jgi:hypothetical protein